MKDPTAMDTSIQSMLEELRTLGTAVDEEDLPGLAKMHGLCQQVGTAFDEAGGDGGEGVSSLATNMITAFEGLILGEVSDRGHALEAVVEQISELEKLVSSSAAPPDAAAPSDETGSEEATTPPAADVVEADDVAADVVEVDDADPEEPAYDQQPLLIPASEIEIVQGFLEEATEHLDAIEAAVLEVERAPDDTERINGLFRPFHTIKGAAGFLNLRDINGITHEVETLLDQARKGTRTISPGLIDLVFDVVDILKAQVASLSAFVANPDENAVPQPPISSMIGHLRSVVSGVKEPGRFGASGGSGDQKVGENLVDQGAVPQEVVDFAVDTQEGRVDGTKTGEILIDMGVATPKQVSQAIRPQAEAARAAESGSPQKALDQTVRIDTAKLDSLVDMVGELVIAQTQVGANPSIISDPLLSKDIGRATKIVRDVQELSMAMRMVPIGATFSKMARLVRDVSRKAGKNVQLSISGEDTELDKNVIQQIGDPLVHMVRNAVDHGVEPPEGRREAGKPESGKVHLAAFHHGGNIFIDISDDGRGLDPEKLLAKGIEKGIVQPDEELTEQQIYQLVFAPGFSTAATVTDISGRGVGMDVVKRNIEQLRGSVEITSKLGEGSKFSIRLPLTLAIIDGMIVRVANERFIIQTTGVDQALRPKPGQLTTVQKRGEMLNVRGRLIPLIQLGQLFGLSDRVDPFEAMVVIAECDAGHVGIVVDELVGQQQVVIKTLGPQFKRLRGISGAAILGDGRVGLILETSGLAAAHRLRPASTYSEQSAASSESAPRDANATDTEPTLVPV